MLHLLKLAVGCATADELAERQRLRASADPPLRHQTRNVPRRAAEIAGLGSIFWVIGGAVQLRQRILAIAPDRWDDGSACCALHLDPALVPVQRRPIKPFQGWRYLEAAAAPPDLPARAAAREAVAEAAAAAMPPRMKRELAALGLL